MSVGLSECLPYLWYKKTLRCHRFVGSNPLGVLLGVKVEIKGAWEGCLSGIVVYVWYVQEVQEFVGWWCCTRDGWGQHGMVVDSEA